MKKGAHGVFGGPSGLYVYDGLCVYFVHYQPLTHDFPVYNTRPTVAR
jgi:hypothetical protein